jgi:hypothetical protein
MAPSLATIASLAVTVGADQAALASRTALHRIAPVAASTAKRWGPFRSGLSEVTRANAGVDHFSLRN